MVTPSINLSEDLHHLAKHSDKSISQLARGGIERGIIEELVGVCWYCGTGISGGEHRWTGKDPRTSHPVQACERCLEDYTSRDSYLELAYEGNNSYDVDISELPPTEIAYAAESASVFLADCYHAGELDESDTALYWAAKSRHEGIVRDDRIPLIEIALRSHVLSLSKGNRTLPILVTMLSAAVNCSMLYLSERLVPPSIEITDEEVLKRLSQNEGSGVEAAFSHLYDRIDPYISESGRYCPACGVAKNKGAKMCSVCFHRWEDCPDNLCEGEVVYFIDPEREDEEWLVTNCWECRECEQPVADKQTKEKFKQRYRRVFEELEDEHIDIDPKLIPE